jgi:hypothetical protein
MEAVRILFGISETYMHSQWVLLSLSLSNVAKRIVCRHSVIHRALRRHIENKHNDSPHNDGDNDNEGDADNNPFDINPNNNTPCLPHNVETVLSKNEITE